jgi:hypothetical protein
VSHWRLAYNSNIVGGILISDLNIWSQYKTGNPPGSMKGKYFTLFIRNVLSASPPPFALISHDEVWATPKHSRSFTLQQGVVETLRCWWDTRKERA